MTAAGDISVADGGKSGLIGEFYKDCMSGVVFAGIIEIM